MFWKKKEKPIETPKAIASPKRDGFYSKSNTMQVRRRKDYKHILNSIQVTKLNVHNSADGVAMDSAVLPSPLKSGGYHGGLSWNVPESQVIWYSQQGFIGYNLCAIMAQNWLINKACEVPGRDAIRNGYKINITDGSEKNDKAMDRIVQLDKEWDINGKMEEFVHLGRVYGLRIAVFLYDGIDYEAPFNPDGIRPGSYKGISQVDPIWCVPELEQINTDNPAAPDFYEPTWWIIGNQRYHKSHLVIFRGSRVPDVLKPTYRFGGVSIPQKVFERVYAAERTANEAPQLALTKRTTALHTDISEVIENQTAFEQRMAMGEYFRDNFQKVILGLDETMEQHETTLTGLQEIIDGQYHIVASIVNMPITKLMGTSAKGLNATGEGDESSYHEELESIQAHDLTPLLNRHHLCLIRSNIAPEFDMKPFNTNVSWEPLDAMTAKEKAELNNLKANTDAIYCELGAIDNDDVRDRLINDPESDYQHLTGPAPEEEPVEPTTVKPDEKFNDKQA